jgi:hypothetical protein
MIVSHKYKFIFLKTRKTAGSSIQKVLLNFLGDSDIVLTDGRDGHQRKNATTLLEPHAGWMEISTHYPDEWENYYKFTVERNSWDKAVSSYFFYKSIKPKKVKRGFDYFVLNGKHQMVNDWPRYADQSDNIVVDAILKYENLYDDFLELTKTLQIPYNNELENTFVKSEHRLIKDYKNMYNDETQQKIADIFKKPIDYFDYVF